MRAELMRTRGFRALPTCAASRNRPIALPGELVCGRLYGYTFFGVDFTPDGCDGGCFHLVRKGNLRIEIHFAAALAQTVNVVVYGEFEAVLEIDKGRNVIYDY